MTKKAIETLRNGLEDSHWYSDDDEKIFNELVIKAKAYEKIRQVFKNNPGVKDEKKLWNIYFESFKVVRELESSETNA